jgi:hypothetical protein
MMRVLLACALVLLTLLAGCSTTESFPPLLVVSELGPSEVEIGDHVEVRGDGFPVGRTAQVTFRGALHRLGGASIEDATIAVRGFASSHSTVELRVDEEVRAAFAGRSTHCTFEGEVSVAFPGSGLAPVYGVLPHATLDVRGLHHGLTAEARGDGDGDGHGKEVGVELLRRHGIEAELVGTQLLIAQVVDGSRGAQAGFVRGDVLVSWNGLRVTGFSDIDSETEAQTIPVVLRHADSVKEERARLALHPELQRVPNDALRALSLLTLLGLATALLVASPWRRLRGIWAGVLGSEELASLTLTSSNTEGPYHRTLRLLAGAGVIAVFAALPFLGFLIIRDFDVPIVAGLFALVSGMHMRSGAPANRAFRSVLSACAIQSVALLIILGISFILGTSRLWEIGASQGPMPWAWNAFRNPAWTVCAMLLVATCVTKLERSESRISGTDKLLLRLRTALGACTLTTVFFGAGRLPESWEVSRYHLAATALGAAVFAVKASLTAAGLERILRTIGAAPGDAVFSWTAAKLVALVVAALAMAALGVRFAFGQQSEQLIAQCTFALVLILGVRVAFSVWNPLSWPWQTRPRIARPTEADFGTRF